MKIEPPLSTAVFWRGGEKIDLNGLKPDAVWCLSVTGERKVNLSFLRDYPNLEELILMEKCEGVEVLSELKQLHTLSLWLSYTVPMAVGPCFLGQCFSPRPACSPPAWRKEWRHYPTSHQHYLSPFGGNAENGRSCPFPDSSDPASETLSPVTPSCAGTTGSGWASFPLCTSCAETTGSGWASIPLCSETL